MSNELLPQDPIPMKEIQDSPQLQKALKFTETAGIFEALNNALNDHIQRQESIKDSLDFLKKHNIELPDGINVIFTNNPDKLKPIPNGSYEVSLTKCIRYWKKDKKDGPPVLQTFCFGILTTPTKFSPMG